MMKRIHIAPPNILAVLNALKTALFLVMVLMFVNFNAKLAEEQAQTRVITSSTNNIVKSQGDILAAIKQVTDDTHNTAAQQTAIIICMLQVPISQRTTDLQAQCRKSATGSAVSSSTSKNTGGTSQSSVQSSSSKTTSSGQTSQSNTSQSTTQAATPTPAPTLLNCTVDVLFVHIGC